MSATKPLTGIHILVTRPAHQAAYLADKIRTMGGNPVLFPVLEITDITDNSPLLELINRLEQFDLAIFVSPNAVNKAMHWIDMKRMLPPNLRIATVGKSSADALKRYGVKEVLTPIGRSDSEALLEKEELQYMNGKQVVIFRGNDGRNLLGDTLIKRGAAVEYAECYHRSKPNVDTTSLLAAWSQHKLNAITITSSEGLHNFIAIIGKSGQKLLPMTPLFTTHERIAQTARSLGFEHVITTTDTGDEGLLQGLLDYFQITKNQG